MSDEAKPGRGLIGKLKGALGGESAGRHDVPDRRAVRRLTLAIPVRLRVGGGELRTRRLRDISQKAMAVEAAGGGAPGDAVEVHFEGYPEVCDPFVLAGTVVRATEEQSPGLVIEIDRRRTSDEVLRQYRTLVLHYIRHKPLLDEVGRGYFEGRCGSCGWIGRVGAKKPTCPRCGGAVAAIEETP